jgi:preprotein translocase subunit SecA
MNSVWGDFARMIFHVEVTIEGDGGGGGAVPPPRRPSASSSSSTGSRNVTYSGGGMAQPSALAMAAAAGGGAGEQYTDEDMPPLPVVEQRRVDENEQLGRNDPCWCGSGKKFKKCHGA